MARTRRHIIRVGVTGGIGSGKSLVCEVFAEAGIPILSADEIAKNLSTEHPSLRQRIRALLGEQAYKSDGTLDRSFVASRIFSNKKLQLKLNAIVHPAVEKEIDRRVASLEREGRRLVVVEAALIYEAGLDKKLDAVIVVDAAETERIRRVMRRDAVPEVEVRGRIEAQWPIEKKARKADFVLVNNGSVEGLRERAMFLCSLIMSMAAKESP